MDKDIIKNVDILKKMGIYEEFIDEIMNHKSIVELNRARKSCEPINSGLYWASAAKGSQ